MLEGEGENKVRRMAEEIKDVCATLAELLQLKPESVRAKKPTTQLETQVSMVDNVWYAYIKFYSFANIHPR